MNDKQKLELLAPAGNLEKMKTALLFGADAVYFGLPDFSLRAKSNQFSQDDILSAQEICRNNKKKFYLTMNIYAHNIHLDKIKRQLEWLVDNQIKPNGIIVSDSGIVRLIKKYLPQVDLHLSTQANITNLEAVKFWWEQGVRRVVLAREVTLDEIKEIHQAVPEMELEVFVHGAMCMSYSGRCILSKWMTNRSANLGDCAQPCRWKWKKEMNIERENYSDLKIDLIDDKDRFGMRVEEDQHGTYMFNSYDLSLIEHLDKLIEAGVMSFKVEGRAKSAYYVATVIKAYRQVIDYLINSLDDKFKFNKIIQSTKKELSKLSHRGYWTGFVLGEEPPHLFDRAYITTPWEFVGISMSIKNANNSVFNQGKKVFKEHDVFVHNKLAAGDVVEIITPTKNIKNKVVKIFNEQGEEIESAHGGLGKVFKVIFVDNVTEIFLIRKK